MRRPPSPMAGNADRVRREVLLLVALVVAVDVLFIVAYFLAGLGAASPAIKFGYTVLWTLATLALALRGLTRVRAARLRGTSGS